MTVGELLGRISSKELAEWMAYSQIEPFGEQRADLRCAIIACTMANAWRGKNQTAFKPKDFMAFVDSTRSQPKPLTGKLGSQIAKRMVTHGHNRNPVSKRKSTHGRV